MPTITEKINEIIDRRLGRGQWTGRGRLQQIERAEAKMELIRQRIKELQDLLELIRHQQTEQRGEYYAMLQKESEMKEKLEAVNTANVMEGITALEEELEVLKKRFSRESVQIAMIGRERQGKSTLIQSITNLGNDVIPAFDGSSCTGAVSIIHNYDGPFYVDLTFFERSELVTTINDKLKRYFPGQSFRITSPEQIPSLATQIGDSARGDALKFKTDYIDHYTDYCELIGHTPMTLNEEAIVAQYVAQYQLFTEREQAPVGYEVEETPTKDGKGVQYKVLYFKYLAVKSANIFTRFEYRDSGKLVLVDTIGIGPKDDGSIRAQMLKVIREDCDGAIDIFRPDSLGNCIDDKQHEILKAISLKFADRMVDKWFVYVINEVREGDGRNMHLTPQLLKDAQALANGDETKFAWATKVCGKDQGEVIQNLVIPQLNLITENLDDIDLSMMKKAEAKSLALYNEYVMLCQSVRAVLSSSFLSQGQPIKDLEDLFKKLTISSAMRQLDDTKFSMQDKPCEEIAARLSEITEETIFDALPDLDEIIKEVKDGVLTPVEIFTKKIHEFRNRIFDFYEDVNIEQLRPLQEAVKMEMMELLYDEGMLGKIPLVGYNASDGPSTEWLAVLIKETADQKNYPDIYDALHLILDYQISIEGLIEYNVAKSVHLINPMYPEFYTMPFIPLPTNNVEDQANHILQEIFNRITHIQENMRKWTNDFAMIPSHSFFARVRKVREKLFLSPEGFKQLRYYYFANSSSVWREEIKGKEMVATAFGGWNDMCEQLSALMDKKNFEI